MNIVLIETSGNQRYIFATNKLRENVGASELTYRVGTETVLQAIKSVAGIDLLLKNDSDGSGLRAALLDPTKNRPIGNGNKVEVIVATSGKAILLVDEKPTAERIIREVTQAALRDMPGLTVHGAISSKVETNLSNIHKAIGEVHRKLEDVRYQIPSNEQRFLRLPFAAHCSTSGLPASEIEIFYETQNNKRKEVDRKAFSKTALAKRNVLLDRGKSKREKEAFEKSRIIALLEGKFNVRLFENLDTLEKHFKDKLEWLAVIHADGNGLGEIFLNFDKHTGLKDGKCLPREYIEKYRKFSLALDICTINAAGQALKNLQQRFRAEEEEKAKRQGRSLNDIPKETPVVPLVLGGDDLTVLCDGQYALKFTYEFLREFEAETEKLSEKDHSKEVIEKLRGIISEIATAAFGLPKLGICAGIAIIKPHFPFHQAYELAESLLKSAKQVKEKIKRRHNSDDVTHPCSALDYHILYDSTASELSAIRDKLKADNEATWLYARPYVVSKFEEGCPSHDWLTPRKWDELEKRVAAMMERDDDNKRKLPNSQLHALREALFLGKDEADARVNLIRHRYQEKELEHGFDVLLCDKNKEKPSLFFNEKRDDKDGNATHFLDALDIVEFRKGEKEDGGKLVDKQSNNVATA